MASMQPRESIAQEIDTKLRSPVVVVAVAVYNKVINRDRSTATR